MVCRAELYESETPRLAAVFVGYDAGRDRLIASVREQLEQVVIRYAKGETSNKQFRHTLPSRVGGYCTRF
jgi:hypothetical protein